MTGGQVRSATTRRLAGTVIVAAVAALTLWVHLFELNAAPLFDSAAFLTIGKLLQRGLLLYRDLWDTKPPGIYLYQSAVFAVLPVEVFSLRVTDWVLYVAAGVLFYRLCAIEARWPLALAGTAAWLFLAHHPSFNVAGFYTEEYSAIAAIGAVAAAARYWRRGGLVWVPASGVAVAMAVLFKHPGAACGLPVVILISARRPRRALPLLLLSAALPLLLVAGYFWWHGALDALLDCQFFHLLTQHGITEPLAPGARLRELLQQVLAKLGAEPLWLLPAAVGIAVALLRPTRWRVAVVVWLIADLILLAAQRFYFEHYFIQLFPSVILLSVIGLAALLQARRGEHVALSLARLALCIVVIGVALRPVEAAISRRQRTVYLNWSTLLHDRANLRRDPGGPFEVNLGAYLREHTAPDERVFIIETGTAVAAYWIADRLPASRYIFSTQVLASPARQAEQRAELERTRPAYVVVVGRPPDYYLTPWIEQGYYLEGVYDLYETRAELWARNDRRGR